ncbi:type II toxin-antitoxin system VapC family toxin [Gloeocapsopsis crepidinum LEGE 06123]|uniref:Type II toxin-antitoxin system VapC family toxin n=1 Tax=Gloeocapsopsis crepidinum LEGE 06123 TaxID=588587 RepID=A0ABR9UXA1_9CHRO|nr:type II toxin-antitoxin system VapC family toxin [Gloeocapsopsis crepidinum]MBE9191933.1 type II toxin-antitoxin system VapC family toxin [Gloeocapsopsis crepidinum LEGE 06123]
MLLVIDSSVLAKWLFPEPLQSQARALRQDWESSTVELIAPNLMFVEVGNIIWKKQRLGLITQEEATSSILDLLDLEIPTVESQVILAEAYSLAECFDRTVYDALYLALAQVNSANMITADLRLYNAVASKLDFVEYLGHYQGLADRE